MEEKQKQSSLRNETIKANRASETEEQRKERLRIRRKKERARRRTKKLQEEKKKSSETEDHEKQCLATLTRLKRGDEIYKNHQLWSASLILHYMHLITSTLY